MPPSDEHEPETALESAAPQADGQARAPLFPVVGVGAAAGGLEAFTHLLEHLPENTGAALVLVQHLDPKRESKLAELLARATRLPVLEAAHGLALQPNHVYVAPPNTYLALGQGVLQLTPASDERAPHLPIDRFLKALAEDRQTGAIGVILSGTGTDGTLGVEEIKAGGGFVFAQDEPSAKYPSMPQSAVRSGCVDLVLSPAEIARELGRIGQHPYVTPTESAPLDALATEEKAQFKKILAIVRGAVGVDFSGYRDTTIKRRIMRRMVLHTKDSLGEYIQLLERDRAEVEALYNDLLITVTSFFRDAEAFEVLKNNVYPEILKTHDAREALRVWVVGCATGQEAYSVAMTLLEFLEDKPIRPAIQIFATDLSDNVSLRKAREGAYPQNIEAEVSPERLRRFFSKEDDKYRIHKYIRDMCVFAKQNATADPPFSHVDLITCRNMLIYLAPPLQKRVIPTFHYALNPVGYLLLGPAETIGGFTDLFGVVDHQHRIYVKKTVSARQYPHFSAASARAGAESEVQGGPASGIPAVDWQREADRVLLGRYAPPGVLVNDDLNILQFRGRTSPFLEPAPGEPTFHLLRMAREGLFPELRNLIQECRRQGGAVHRPGMRVRDGERVREIDLRVLPVQLPGNGANCFLVLFEESHSPDKPSAAAGAAPAGILGTLTRWLRGRASSPAPASGAREAPAALDGGEAAGLRQELASTREYLQSLIEHRDAANEELKSANEEILSSNEELQSTNEELETAKEELQSVNEELTTVNEQLQHRNQELTRLSDDLSNLLGSADVPMIVLGVDLRIRRFTPSAAQVLDLLGGDLGRPIGNIRLPFDLPDLEALATEVIRTVRTEEREVRDRQGRWYALRVRPYRTADNKIDGAVLVFMDIEEIKSAGERLRDALAYARAIVDTLREPVLVLDAALRVRSANRAFYETFQVTPAATENQFLYDLGNQQWDIPRLRELLEEILPRQTTVEEFEIRHTFETIGPKIMLLNARQIVPEGAKAAELILLAIDDISERKRAEAALRRSEEHFRLLADNVKDYAIFFLDPRGSINGWDEGAARILGYRANEVVGQTATRFFTPEDVQNGLPEQELLTAEREGQAADDNWLVRQDKTRFWASGVTTALRDDAGTLRGFVKILRDNTEQKHAEEALAESEHRLNVALAAAQMGTWHWHIPANRQTLDENLNHLCGLEIHGKSVQSLEGFLGIIHPEDRATVAAAFHQSVRENKAFGVEFRVVWPDGAIRWLKDQGDVFYDNDGKPLSMAGACVDITSRKHAEDELRRARDELEERVQERTTELRTANATLEDQFAQRQELLRRLGTAEEDQRRRIARELHDQMGQHLTTLMLGLKKLEENGASAPEELRRLQELANQIGREAHRIALELRPTALDDLGLHATLLYYVEDWAGRFHIQADFHSDLETRRLSTEIETTVYRIVQEALTNVVKHARATHVSVLLERRPNQLLVIVEDNGGGFDAAEMLNPAPPSRRLGLLGMKERASLVGGTLEVESNPGGGTTIFVHIPWAEPEGDRANG